jgi:septal ring factor EnvC (AmiA/AmiB activator)
LPRKRKVAPTATPLKVAPTATPLKKKKFCARPPRSVKHSAEDETSDTENAAGTVPTHLRAEIAKMEKALAREKSVSKGLRSDVTQARKENTAASKAAQAVASKAQEAQQELLEANKELQEVKQELRKAQAQVRQEEAKAFTERSAAAHFVPLQSEHKTYTMSEMMNLSMLFGRRQ